MRSQHQWQPFVFVLHLAMAVLVLFQLSMILLKDYASFSHGATILAHKIGGLLTLLVLTIYLLTKSLTGSLFDIFPWKQLGRHRIGQDIKTLLSGRIPVRSKGGLASLIQGLGVLLVFLMALSGAIAWLLFLNPLTQHLAGQLFQVHRIFGSLVWWFVGGHAGMAILHRLMPNRYQVVIHE